MSLSLKKLDVINVKDPRVQVNYKSDFVYLEGASQVSQKLYTTTSVSNSSLQFSCPPPSANNFVDRKIYLQAGIRLTFIGASTAAGQFLLNQGQDAPRCYPLSSAIDVINCTINNFSVSNNLADYIQPLLRYNVSNRLKNHMYSSAPSYPDQSQLYSSLVASVRNPLGGYHDTTDENVQGRGGYARYAIVSQTAVGATGGIQPSTAAGQLMTTVVDMVSTEPFFILSPLYWGCEETHPFVHVNTMDFNITILNQAANRLWSRSELALPLTSLVYTFSSLINSGPPFSFPENQPTIQFNYFTPKETQIVPRDMISVYPYFDLQRFPTDLSGITQWPTYTSYTSNNIQLSSIPRRIYVYARFRNQDLYSSPTNTDTFLSISNVSIQYFNRTGLLSSASQQQLYEMSVKNGCSLSYTQWIGGPVYAPGVGGFNPPLYGSTGSTQYGTVGSILCIDTATDLGLDSLQAPGKIDHNTFQITVGLSSLNPNSNGTATLYIVVVNEGCFSIGPGTGQASAQIGVLSSQDILDAKQNMHYYNYETIKDIQGGDFFSGVKDFFLNKVLPVIKKSKIASNLANLIPVAGPAISKSLRNLGYGEGQGGVLVDYRGGDYADNMYGDGVMVGGRQMHRKELKNSMKNRAMM